MSDNELDEPVTKRYLGEFTETVLLPAMSSMMDEKLKPLGDDVQALSAKVTTYLELSDKRYLELKNKYRLLGKWVKQIADKTGVNIDITELEKF